MRKDVVRMLERARAKVQKGWTQDTYARNKAGNSCRFDSRTAVKWCVVGAILSVEGMSAGLARMVADAVDTNNLLEWNDRSGRTKREVVRAFDKAIKVARENG